LFDYQRVESGMAEDLVLTILKDMRTEAPEFREETRDNFATVVHRLNLVEARLTDLESRLTSLEAHMAALLNIVPVVNQRIDRLEARLAALEARVG
jgi:uncharacterized coiled-coil protein SlyX